MTTPPRHGASVPIAKGLLLPPAIVALRPMALLKSMARQPFPVWAILLYIFFEYVRPQTIYPWLDVLPFARLSLLASVVGAALSPSRRRWTIVDTAMVVFTLVVLASLPTAFNPAHGMDNLGLFMSWAAVYWVLGRTINTQTRVVLLLVTWFLWNLKMSLFAFRHWASIGFGFSDWGIGGAPGWFENSGEFGIQMCVVLPISLYFALGVRRQVSKPVFLALLLLPVTAVAGTLASASRGALLGVAAVSLWILFRSRYKVRGTLALVAFLGAFYFLVPEEQKARLSSAGEDATSVTRLTYWKRGLEIARTHPLLGVGFKNWTPYNAATWTGGETGNERLGLPHNIFIEAVAELGYVGLLALLFLISACFFLNARTRALARRLGEQGRLGEQLAWGFDGAMVGFVVSGFFVTVLYYPYLWVNLGMAVALHGSVARAAKSLPTRPRRRHRSPLLLAEPAPAGGMPARA